MPPGRKKGKAVASKPKKAASKKTVAKRKTEKPVPKGRSPKAVPRRAVKKTHARKVVPKPSAPTRKIKKKETQESGLREIRKMLLKQREQIVKEAKAEIAKYMSGENRQLVDTALDEGDWAVVDISEDLNLRRLSSHRRALHDIDEVLRKMKEGTYGICEECGEEISPKRLMVIPTASLCLNCKENKEQLEAVEEGEGL